MPTTSRTAAIVTMTPIHVGRFASQVATQIPAMTSTEKTMTSASSMASAGRARRSPRHTQKSLVDLGMEGQLKSHDGRERHDDASGQHAEDGAPTPLLS